MSQLATTAGTVRQALLRDRDQNPVVQRKRRTPWKSWLLFLLFAGPNVALLIIFTYKPLLQSLQYSLLQWNIGSATARFVGLDNYASWFTDPSTANVVRVTVIFTLATVVGGMVLGLSLALLLNRKLRGTGLARTVVVAPYVLSGVAVGLLWLFVFDPNFGVLGAILKGIGVGSPDWYNDPAWALPMLITVYLWKNVGYVALIYLAALQAVPKDLMEAATLDGAGAFASFRNVVLPLLGPTTFFLSVTTLLSSLQSFDIIQAMTKGGPLEGTTTMMYQIYQEGFATGRAGYSSAIATILFFVLLVITAVQMLFIQKKVHY
ncbi:putative ABC-type sugar transport system, permease component [Arthrobacter sp. PAMC 25486]|uniref:carbohydrate ABC transporter permease n=1 Tax=Arthrobacter sp. PAMC 25486 TaxID=1494608 RepID=UPI0005363DB7|nr:sugar ABC transporter permease [Arthrobacter sp. PAMC 25486]AIY01698.1 putative ABC-type sugar transport system, permease component [Arthrobacter sp. PAMC 25486]